MRKHILKSIGAMAMAAAMATTMMVSVSAAPSDIIDTSRAGSLTIHKYDLTAAEAAGVDVSGYQNNGEVDAEAAAELANYAIAGVEYTYIRVGDINTSSENGEIKLLYDIPNQLETVLELEDTRNNNNYTSDELNEALADLMTDNTAGKDALFDYFEAAPGKTAMDLTDNTGMARDTEMELGLYLVVETKVPANVHTTTDPFFVSLPMTDETGDEWFYDVNVYPKNQTETEQVDKLVKQHDDTDASYQDIATGSIGDQMDYTFVTKLPKITDQATYLTQYQFADTIQEGLTYNKDFTIYIYGNRTDAEANATSAAIATWQQGQGNFTVTYANEDKNATIALTEAGLAAINPAYSEYYMVVSYSCVINNDAVLGDASNPNDVTLSYSRTNTADIETVTDTARVFSYGINLEKTFSGQVGNPENVQFVLQNQTNGHYITAVAASAGVYNVTDNNKSSDEANATKFSPNADGSLIINGLEADTYVLTEIHTDAGFSLLKEPMTIVINQTIDEIIPSTNTLYDSTTEDTPVVVNNGDRASATVDGSAANMSSDDTSANAYVDMVVVNTPTFVLPQTGGNGTLIFTLAGCGIALAAFAFVMVRRNNKSEEK